MNLCNMLIYLLSLCVLNCAVLSVTTNTYAPHAVTTYFACMRGQRMTLPSDCQVSAGPPRRGMFAGQSDRKLPKVIFSCCEKKRAQQGHDTRMLGRFAFPRVDNHEVVTVESDTLLPPSVAPSEGKRMCMDV